MSDGEVTRDRDGYFHISRKEIDTINGNADAMFLFIILVDQHGHKKNPVFGLAFDKMREAGITNMSIPRLRAARRLLQAHGLLTLVSNHRAGSVHQKYHLTRMGMAPKMPAKKSAWSTPKERREEKAVREAAGYRADVFEIEDGPE